MKRDTVGKIASDLKKKETDNTHTPIDQMREQLTDYEKNLFECVEENKDNYSHDFYIVVLTKKERLMDNVLRNFFFARESCPTPGFDQAVYKYWKNDDYLDFLWVIPSKDTCEFMADYCLVIPDDQKDLLKFVLDFNDGTLLNRAKILNKEGY